MGLMEGQNNDLKYVLGSIFLGSEAKNLTAPANNGAEHSWMGLLILSTSYQIVPFIQKHLPPA